MSSFKEIYDLYKHQVYFYVKKSLKNSDDIEDITQEIFIHLWKHRETLKNTVNLEAIVFKTCNQEISNFYRKNKLAFDNLEEDDALESYYTSDDEDLVKEERITKMTTLLNKLPKDSKEILVLNKVEKVSMSEIGEDYKLSKSAIEKRINKTITFLRSNLPFF